MWLLVTPLNSQGPEPAKASHPIVILRKALEFTQPHLPHLQNGPRQFPSLSRSSERGWKQRVNATLTFTPSLGSQLGNTLAGVLMTFSFPHPQTQPLVLLELRVVMPSSVTQFPQL